MYGSLQTVTEQSPVRMLTGTGGSLIFLEQAILSWDSCKDLSTLLCFTLGRKLPICNSCTLILALGLLESTE